MQLYKYLSTLFFDSKTCFCVHCERSRFHEADPLECLLKSAEGVKMQCLYQTVGALESVLGL